MDEITAFWLEEVKSKVTRRNDFDDYLDDSEKYRSELLKKRKVNNNTSSVIYVKSCENNDASQPCEPRYNFYNRKVSALFICKEKIKNPVIVKEESRNKEN